MKIKRDLWKVVEIPFIEKSNILMENRKQSVFKLLNKEQLLNVTRQSPSIQGTFCLCTLMYVCANDDDVALSK